jgi:diguanylate cyclase (GGDEF)-like protein
LRDWWFAGGGLALGWAVCSWWWKAVRARQEPVAVASARREYDHALADARSSVARLEVEKRQLSAIVNLLPNVARALTSSTEKREIVPLIGMIVERLVEPAEVHVFLRARDSEGMVLAFAGGAQPSNLALGHRVPHETGRLATSARYRRILDSSDFSERSRYPVSPDPAIAAIERRLTICVPILAGDAMLGVIAVGGATGPLPELKRALRVPAELGANALVNAMNYRAARLAAETDPLTRLFNRRAFKARLEQVLERAAERGQRMSLLLIDLDHFKHYNDQHGHLAGDQALVGVAELVTGSTRSDDLVARYGGEEFAVALVDDDQQSAWRVAEKIRESIASAPFPGGPTQPLGCVSISGGVATFPQDGSTVDQLLAAADAALYVAKRAGRNRIHCFEPENALAIENTGEVEGET